MEVTNKQDLKIRKLTLTGLMIAFTFIAGSIIKIPTLNGMIQLGDCMVLLSAVLLGKKYGFFAAATGMVLVDILGGYVIWAPFTFIIKGLVALTVSIIISRSKEKGFKTFLFAFILGGIINVVGYFIGNAIMGGIIVGASKGFLGSMIYAFSHLFGDIIQTVAGIVIALPLAKMVYKFKLKAFN